MSKKVSIQKIRYHLGTDENQLAFLNEIDEEDLEELLDQLTSRLDKEESDIWIKLAKVSTFMPAFVTAKVSETIMGEVVCAHVAVHMKVKDALKVLKHLSIDFLAKVSTHLSPKKCEELINAIPLKTVMKVSRSLLRDNEYYTLSCFVDVLDLSKVIQVIDIIEEESDLLKISSFVNNKSLIARIVEQLPDKRISKLIEVAYKEDFTAEIFTVFHQLSSDQLHRVLSIAKKLPNDQKNEIVKDLNKRFLNRS